MLCSMERLPSPAKGGLGVSGSRWSCKLYQRGQTSRGALLSQMSLSVKLDLTDPASDRTRTQTE